MAAKPAILAVDDDVPVLRAVERDLRTRYGDTYRIIGAGSGAEALEVARELTQRGEAVALFLVDQRMPTMTGTELLAEAIPLQPDAKRVLLTAYADTDVAIRAINELRLDQYLLKPWEPPEERLYPVVDDLLEDWVASFRLFRNSTIDDRSPITCAKSVNKTAMNNCRPSPIDSRARPSSITRNAWSRSTADSRLTSQGMWRLSRYPPEMVRLSRFPRLMVRRSIRRWTRT